MKTCEVCRGRKATQFDRCAPCDDTAWSVARMIRDREQPVVLGPTRVTAETHALFDLYEEVLEVFRRHYAGEQGLLRALEERAGIERPARAVAALREGPTRPPLAADLFEDE